MAYLLGMVSAEEEAELKRRGWDILLPRSTLYCSNELGKSEVVKPEDGLAGRMIMIPVDTDLFEIMSGPDWDKATVKKVVECPQCGCSTTAGVCDSQPWHTS